MTGLFIRPLILVCVFAAVVLAAELFLRSWSVARGQQKRINRRLTMIAKGEVAGEEVRLLRRSTSSVPEGLPPFLDHLAHNIERRVLQAQLPVDTSTVLTLIILLPIAIFFALMMAMLLVWHMEINLGRIMIAAIFSVGTGASLPLMAINFKANRRRRRVEEQFPIALDVFVRGLRAGHPVAAALELLTVEMPDPIGSEFGYVVDEVTYGAELRDALQNMAERWDSDDMRMFVVSLSIQSETGGNLAEILENLSGVIREREAMAMNVRALSSEGRLTAVMLSILPLGTFAIIFVANPKFFLDVAGDPWFVPGVIVLLGLYLIGFWSIRRMVNLKV